MGVMFTNLANELGHHLAEGKDSEEITNKYLAQ
jgi:hypothetical protein